MTLVITWPVSLPPVSAWPSLSYTIQVEKTSHGFYHVLLLLFTQKSSEGHPFANCQASWWSSKSWCSLIGQGASFYPGPHHSRYASAHSDYSCLSHMLSQGPLHSHPPTFLECPPDQLVTSRFIFLDSA